jgi:hypothetical protein
MSDNQLDRIERKINRIGTFLIMLGAASLTALMFAIFRWENVSLSPLQMGVLVAIGVTLIYAIWRPFRP